MISFGLLHLKKNTAISSPSIPTGVSEIEDVRHIVNIKLRLCLSDDPKHRGYDQKFDLTNSGTITKDDLDACIAYLLYGIVPPKYLQGA